MNWNTNKMEIEKLEELRKVIEASPLTQKIKKDQAAEILAIRKEAADRITVLKKEAENHVAKRIEIDGMVERWGGIDRERQELEVEIGKKRAAFARDGLDIEGESRRQQEILYSCYDPALDEAIKFCRDRYEISLHKSVNSQTRAGERNIFTMVKNMITFSNARSIENALAYCLLAIRELEAMKLDPVLDVERIETLKKGIPNIDELTEITTEKPFPKVNTDPRALLKSDSQIDYEIGKLTEKFKKVMKR